MADQSKPTVKVTQTPAVKAKVQQPQQGVGGDEKKGCNCSRTQRRQGRG